MTIMQEITSPSILIWRNAISLMQKLKSPFNDKTSLGEFASPTLVPFYLYFNKG